MGFGWSWDRDGVGMGDVGCTITRYCQLLLDNQRNQCMLGRCVDAVRLFLFEYLAVLWLTSFCLPYRPW